MATSDEGFRRPPPTEETPLLVEIGVGQTPETADTVTPDNKNKNKDDDDVVPMPLSRARAVVVAIAVGCLLFIHSTNITAVSTTQSDIAADLDAFSNASWLTSSYMITFASAVPMGGRLSQIFSLRALLAWTSLITSIGLIITACAPTLTVFMIGRAIAGCGAAGLYSIQTIIVLELSSKKRRGVLLGCVFTVITIGVASGAILAGAVTPVWGWRSLYYIQSPICLIIAPILYLYVPSTSKGGESSDKLESFWSKLARIDYLGILAMTSAIVLLLYSLSSPTISYQFLATSSVIFVIFLAIESSPGLTTEPIIPLSLLRSRAVLLTGIASTGNMMARWAVLFYLPVYCIAVRGWSPAVGGLIMIPTNTGFAFGGLLVGWIHIRKATSYYISSLVISVLFMLSLLLIAELSTQHSSVTLYTIIIFINGFSVGAYLNYITAHVLHLTTPSSHYIVTSIIAMFRSLAGSFGSAIGGGMFSRVLKSRLEAGFYDSIIDSNNNNDDRQELIRKLLGSPVLVWQLEGYEREAAIAAYQEALRMLFLSSVVLAILMTIVQAGAGWAGAEVDSEESEGVIIHDDNAVVVTETRQDGEHE